MILQMKRSYINKKIREGIIFIQKMNFALPPFAYWTPGEWETKEHEYDEIRQCMLGWDITDFCEGDFDKIGLLLITIRNGIAESSEYFKEYAEKILIVQDGQITPMHFHYYKMEDIINRGGGNLMIQVYGSTKSEDLSIEPVEVYIDGRRFTVEAGTILRLKTGESITLPPLQYHKFWAEGGTALIGEVSKVNDDKTDNHFHTAPARFPKIDEDEPKEYLLFTEYPAASG
jgi:D-lyxose ketol-isomerase